ncbi:hypothetical protein BC831DRAFT_549272 [Entophlyctis helioformis]|nr:hypothetical protein BC831DRAFT_549272 [Entophlyctis helioformis]
MSAEMFPCKFEPLDTVDYLADASAPPAKRLATPRNALALQTAVAPATNPTTASSTSTAMPSADSKPPPRPTDDAMFLTQLTHDLMALSSDLAPSVPETALVRWLTGVVSAVCRSSLATTGLHVAMVGSVRCGTALTGDGDDVNLSVELPARSLPTRAKVDAWGNRSDVEVLVRVSRRLREQVWVDGRSVVLTMPSSLSVASVASAAVTDATDASAAEAGPRLTWETSALLGCRVSMSLTAFDQTSVDRSALCVEWTRVYEQSAPLVLLIKALLRQHGLHRRALAGARAGSGSSGGDGLSGYALLNMVVAVILRVREGSRSALRTMLGPLFLDFLKFYGWEHDYGRHAIALRRTASPWQPLTAFIIDRPDAPAHGTQGTHGGVGTREYPINLARADQASRGSSSSSSSNGLTLFISDPLQFGTNIAASATRVHDMRRVFRDVYSRIVQSSRLFSVSPWTDSVLAGAIRRGTGHADQRRAMAATWERVQHTRTILEKRCGPGYVTVNDMLRVMSRW